MTTFEIRPVEEMPARKRPGSLSAAIRALGLDETVFVPLNGTAAHVLANRVRNLAFEAKRRTGRPYHVRQAADGIWVYRTADNGSSPVAAVESTRPRGE